MKGGMVVFTAELRRPLTEVITDVYAVGVAAGWCNDVTHRLRRERRVTAVTQESDAVIPGRRENINKFLYVFPKLE